MNDESRGRGSTGVVCPTPSTPPPASFLPPSPYRAASRLPTTPSCQFESDLDSTPGSSRGLPGITIRPCCRWIRDPYYLLASGIIAGRRFLTTVGRLDSRGGKRGGWRGSVCDNLEKDASGSRTMDEIRFETRESRETGQTTR